MYHRLDIHQTLSPPRYSFNSTAKTEGVEDYYWQKEFSFKIKVVLGKNLQDIVTLSWGRVDDVPIFQVKEN